MLKRSLFPTVSALLLLSLVVGASPGPVRGISAPLAAPDAAEQQRSPLLFVENVGQFASGARFYGQSMAGADLWLASDALWLTVLEPASYVKAPADGVPGRPAGRSTPVIRRGVHLRLSFSGANPRPRIEPFDRLDTAVSYFLGDDPVGWRAAVPVWGGVRYRDLYPGVDLELAGEGGQYVQRLVVGPGADLDRVRLRVEGADGLSVEGGMLNLETAVGVFSLPLLQVVGTGGGAVARGLAEPRVEGLEVLSPLSVSRPSAPELDTRNNAANLLYSSYLGGDSFDHAAALATDDTGSLYVAGYTFSSNFPPTPGAFQEATAGGQDAFVVKMNPAGTDLVYATYLGGGASDAAEDLAVDATGHAYLTGETLSSDFPTTGGAWDTTFDGWSEAFVVKLDPAGTALTYATLLGGTKDDDQGWYNEGGLALALDGTGHAHVAGWTPADDFPTTAGAFQTSFGGDKRGGDGFIAKLKLDGSGLEYASYLGGNAEDVVESIALGDAGTVFATGRTESAGFPTTTGAFDEEHNGGGLDAFVVKVSADGSALEYGTFVGGSASEGAGAVSVDGVGCAYVTGGTGSPDFPTTPGAFAADLSGDSDAFVVKLNPAGSDLVYATYLGGSKAEGGGYAIDTGPGGSVTVGGMTSSDDFPTTPDAYDGSFNPATVGTDATVTRFNPAGTDIAYSTFLGGRISEAVTDLVLAGRSLANLTGYSYSSNFPTTPGAYQRTSGGDQDAFVAKMKVAYVASGSVLHANGTGFDGGATIAAGGPYSATSDVQGAYAIGGLPAGTYTLTPTLAAHVFLPVTRTVTPPPDASNIDFTILPEPVSITLEAGQPRTLVYTDTQGLTTTLDFPSGAVDQPTTLMLTPTIASDGIGYAFGGHAFELTAYKSGIPQPGLLFGAQITVTLRYSDADVRRIDDEYQLGLWRWDGAAWQDAAHTCNPPSVCTRDLAHQVLHVGVCQTGLFGLFGPANRVYLPVILRIH